jgi:hypothetical protein
MKVSKQAYRNKQNQATGQLLVSLLALVMLIFKCYHYFFESEPFVWSDFLWVVILVVTFLTWRWRERQLKTFEVDE